MAPSDPTITLTRAQADALASWLWEELCEAGCDEKLRLVRASVHVFDAVQWQEEERRETYEIRIDSEIAWLATEILWDMLVNWGAPGLAELAKEGVPGRGLALSDEVHDWLLEGHQRQIAEHEHFIAAASALLGGAMDAQLAGA